MTEIFIIVFISQSSLLGALFVITIPNLILLFLPCLIILDEVQSHKIHLLHNSNVGTKRFLKCRVSKKAKLGPFLIEIHVRTL